MKDNSNRGAVLLVVQRYEQMLKAKENLFFDVEEFEQIGEYYIEHGDAAKTLVLCEYALGIYPNTLAIYLLKGQALLSEGKVSEANDFLISCLKKFPENEEVCYFLATSYSRLKQHNKAIEYFKKVLDKTDDYYKLEASFDLVAEYQIADQFDQAFNLLKKMIADYPNNEAVQFELAFCMDRGAYGEEAIDIFTKLTDDNPYSYTGWFNLGNFLLRENRISDALEAFELSAAIKEDYVPALINCGMIHVIQDRADLAIKVFQEVLVVEPHNDFVYCAIAEAYEMIDDNLNAIIYYKKALDVDPHNVDALFGIALVYHYIDDWANTKVYIEQAWKLNDSNEGIILLLARVYFETNHEDEAEDLLMDFLQEQPGAVGVSLELADYYFYKLNDIILALEIIDDTLNVLPAINHLLVIRKATYLHSSGRLKWAYEELNKLLAATNDKELIFNEMVSVYPEVVLDKVIVSMLT